jgi:hypothetical protein
MGTGNAEVFRPLKPARRVPKTAKCHCDALFVPGISCAAVRHGRPCLGVRRTFWRRRSAWLSARKRPVPRRLVGDERPRSEPASPPGRRSNRRSSGSRTGGKTQTVNRLNRRRQGVSGAGRSAWQLLSGRGRDGRSGGGGDGTAQVVWVCGPVPEGHPRIVSRTPDNQGRGCRVICLGPDFRGVRRLRSATAAVAAGLMRKRAKRGKARWRWPRTESVRTRLLSRTNTGHGRTTQTPRPP